MFIKHRICILRLRCIIHIKHIKRKHCLICIFCLRCISCIMCIIHIIQKRRIRLAGRARPASKLAIILRGEASTPGSAKTPGDRLSAIRRRGSASAATVKSPPPTARASTPPGGCARPLPLRGRGHIFWTRCPTPRSRSPMFFLETLEHP